MSFCTGSALSYTLVMFRNRTSKDEPSSYSQEWDFYLGVSVSKLNGYENLFPLAIHGGTSVILVPACQVTSSQYL